MTLRELGFEAFQVSPPRWTNDRGGPGWGTRSLVKDHGPETRARRLEVVFSRVWLEAMA